MSCTFNYWLDDKFQEITLELNETKAFNFGGPTDEGYSNHHYSFEFDGQQVTLTYAWDAKDCDGRVEGGTTMVCPVAELADYVCFDFECNEVMTPNWVNKEEYIRDHSAEAAGY